MLTLLFIIMMIAVFGKLIVLAFKATWGITKILFSFIFLPVILIGMLISGLTALAIPILIVVGIVALVDSAT